jgi:hypothetical protein
MRSGARVHNPSACIGGAGGVIQCGDEGGAVPCWCADGVVARAVREVRRRRWWRIRAERLAMKWCELGDVRLLAWRDPGGLALLRWSSRPWPKEAWSA